MMYVLLAVLLIFILIILIRTLLFVPKNKETSKKEDIDIDYERGILCLQELIKCKTISNEDSSKEDNEEFLKLIDKLPLLYPNVYKYLDYIKINDRAIYYHWKGKDQKKACVLMAHFDVVPVDDEAWSKPAFDGFIEDEVLWGRGTLDTKVTFNGILSAAEFLLKKDFVPSTDIYFAFSGNEEISGPGAKQIVECIKKDKKEITFVVDEGGAVVSGVFPGLSKPCGLVGTCEKGYMNVRLSCKTNGGHASAPLKDNPINMLSKACLDINKHPFKFSLSKPTYEMFDYLGRHTSFLYRIIFSNLWCFSWILNILGKKSGGQLNALFRTTAAFTQTQGSDAPNVIPSSSNMICNIRINPNENIEYVLNRLKKIIDNDKIEITSFDENNPSIISPSNCNEFNIIKKAIEDTWDNTICAPYLMVQGSDSINYEKICDKIYRFSAYDVTDEELETIHGNDEHIRFESIKHSIEFFIRIIQNI